MESCNRCPRKCKIDRQSGAFGFCQSGDLPRVARAALHHWEEPCISGDRGSGAVFFTGCTLRCAFCQNVVISRDGQRGQVFTPAELARVFLRLQEQGAHNINLVTAGHYLPHIIQSLKTAKENGLSLPIVWNSGGYETLEAVSSLAPLVDIWLPDFKFFSPALAKEVARAEDYPEICKAALQAMVALQPKPIFGPDGLLQKGVIVRHLPLPGKLFDSKKIIDWLHQTFGDAIWLSLLNQYTPMESCGIPWLRRPLPEGHYDSLLDYCTDLGMEQVFIQEDSACGTQYIPEFHDIITL